MKTCESNELLFSRNPKISLTDVRGWLDRQKQGDSTVKKELLGFIEHRLRGRYITPLLNVPDKFKSGFLIMASACLLIETLQAFRDGKNESEVGSEAAFMLFFEKHKELFSGLRNSFPSFPKKNKHGDFVKDKMGNVEKKCTFYKHIRCGILHQAETTGRYSVVRDGSALFDPGEKTVNADRFLEQLVACLNKYITELNVDSIASELWNAAAAKLKCVSDNFEHGKVVHIR